MMHAGLAFESRAERHSMSLAGGNLHRTIIAKVHTVLSAMAWMGVNDLARRILDSMSMTSLFAHVAVDVACARPRCGDGSCLSLVQP